MSKPVSGSITLPVLGFMIGLYAGFFSLSLSLSLSGFSGFPGFWGVFGGIMIGITFGSFLGSLSGFSFGDTIRHSSGIDGFFIQGDTSGTSAGHAPVDTCALISSGALLFQTPSLTSHCTLLLDQSESKRPV